MKEDGKIRRKMEERREKEGEEPQKSGEEGK